MRGPVEVPGCEDTLEWDTIETKFNECEERVCAKVISFPSLKNEKNTQICFGISCLRVFRSL